MAITKGEKGEAESVTDRRALRSQYLAVKSLIKEKRDDISSAKFTKFNTIFNEVESLHQQVQKPREQLADAEALLDIANSLAACVRSHCNGGVTPIDFVRCILRGFGGAGEIDPRNSIVWGDIGLDVSNVFTKAKGVSTMIGPMNTEPKEQKPRVQRKRARPAESSQPEELKNTNTDRQSDTDIKMSTMFNILKNKMSVRLENLVLKRNSFAQTVENIFTLSFLVKDGRVEITADESGCHLVSPKNAPAASAVASGEVSHCHFVFRFDFMDWKLMIDLVGDGEELMPDRRQSALPSNCQNEPVPEFSHVTPIRKFSRNRGVVIQEQPILEEPPEKDQKPLM
ncbi:hypothetical protein GIB67_010370 [Kingdonia uniflora]|uniref:Non-structural maintenance of chromosomes element 4 n=1 Tax=Kingdonia uniflora TaxID=39325 RepID=A0A7J7MA71_9MAGN|nr:hypothetical protein GIB67_010370 [Kingdonia uniflora]